MFLEINKKIKAFQEIDLELIQLCQKYAKKPEFVRFILRRRWQMHQCLADLHLAKRDLSSFQTCMKYLEDMQGIIHPHENKDRLIFHAQGCVMFGEYEQAVDLCGQALKIEQDVNCSNKFTSGEVYRCGDVIAIENRIEDVLFNNHHWRRNRSGLFRGVTYLGAASSNWRNQNRSTHVLMPAKKMAVMQELKLEYEEHNLRARVIMVVAKTYMIKQKIKQWPFRQNDIEEMFNEINGLVEKVNSYKSSPGYPLPKSLKMQIAAMRANRGFVMINYKVQVYNSLYRAGSPDQTRTATMMRQKIIESCNAYYTDVDDFLNITNNAGDSLQMKQNKCSVLIRHAFILLNLPHKMQQEVFKLLKTADLMLRRDCKQRIDLHCEIFSVYMQLFSYEDDGWQKNFFLHKAFYWLTAINKYPNENARQAVIQQIGLEFYIMTGNCQSSMQSWLDDNAHAKLVRALKTHVKKSGDGGFANWAQALRVACKYADNLEDIITLCEIVGSHGINEQATGTGKTAMHYIFESTQGARFIIAAHAILQKFDGDVNIRETAKGKTPKDCYKEFLSKNKKQLGCFFKLDRKTASLIKLNKKAKNCNVSCKFQARLRADGSDIVDAWLDLQELGDDQVDEIKYSLAEQGVITDIRDGQLWVDGINLSEEFENEHSVRNGDAISCLKV